MTQEELHKHYQDTNAKLDGYIEKRNKQTVRVLLSIIAFAFLLSNPQGLTDLANAFIKNHTGIEVEIVNFCILNTGIIYLILWYLLQYFQNCLTIEKMYDCIFNLESELSKGEYQISREGKFYAENYPILKNFANIIYVWGIPVSVAAFSIWRFISEMRYNMAYAVVDCIGFFLITISCMLYISDRNLKWEYYSKKNYPTLKWWKRILGSLRIDVKNENSTKHI